MRDRLQRMGLWILVATMGVALIILYTDNKRTRDCMAGYMVRDQQNTVARSVVADTERAKFLEMLVTITNPKETPEARKKALDDYIALVQSNDAVRKRNPILPVPVKCD